MKEQHVSLLSWIGVAVALATAAVTTGCDTQLIDLTGTPPEPPSPM